MGEELERLRARIELADVYRLAELVADAEAELFEEIRKAPPDPIDVEGHPATGVASTAMRHQGQPGERLGQS